MTPAITWKEDGATVETSHGERFLTHAEIAALPGHEAHAYGLPPYMEALLVLRPEGRIDSPQFRLTHSIEPFHYLHPYAVYRRQGAVLWVGEHALRLNPIQLRVFDAMAALERAAGDIPLRLQAWQRLADILHIPGRHHITVEGDFPRLRIHHVSQLPPDAMTRTHGKLEPITDTSTARWAMQHGRVYYYV